MGILDIKNGQEVHTNDGLSGVVEDITNSVVSIRDRDGNIVYRFVGQIVRVN